MWGGAWQWSGHWEESLSENGAHTEGAWEIEGETQGSWQHMSLDSSITPRQPNPQPFCSLSQYSSSLFLFLLTVLFLWMLICLLRANKWVLTDTQCKPQALSFDSTHSSSTVPEHQFAKDSLSYLSLSWDLHWSSDMSEQTVGCWQCICIRDQGACQKITCPKGRGARFSRPHPIRRKVKPHGQGEEQI